jgi:hypothetical protein
MDMRSIRQRIFPSLSAIAIAAMTAICAAPAHGAGIFVDPCGNNQNFAGGSSTVFQCIIGNTAATNAIGGGTGAAGANFFVNHLSPIHFYGDTDAFAATATWTVTTNPNWGAGVVSVPTFLELDGAVKLQGPGSSLTITLTGLLGGPIQTITRTFNWTGAPTEDILAIQSFANQAPAGAAVETLTIGITGRARYDVDGSPNFVGAVPEPSTIALFGAGLAALLYRSTRKRTIS